MQADPESTANPLRSSSRTKSSPFVPGITSEVINNAIIDQYGSLSSPSLYASYSGLTYYLPLEFDPAIELYVKNTKYLDSIIT